MKNLKISFKIALALLLPLLALLFFIGSSLLEKSTTASSMNKLKDLALMGPVISDVVHELQKERGVSAVYLGSEGKLFSDELPPQKTATNDRHNLLNEGLNSFDASSYSDTLANKLNIALSALDELETMRSQIQSQKASVPQMAKYYTTTIAKLLAINEEMTVLSVNPKVTNAIVAYSSFLQGKERSGIERAMGGAGFGVGNFKPSVYKRFVELIAQQEAFFSVFAINASGEQVSFLASEVQGKDVDEVLRMRNIAVASLETNDLEGVTGPYWFKTITAKIELLKKVEDKIAGDLVVLATDIESKASTDFVIMLISSLVLIGVTLVLVVYIARGITVPVVKMTDVMRKLADGNLDIEVPSQNQKDEIGLMSNTVEVFKDNMLKARELEHQQEENRRRSEEEKKALMESLALSFEENVSSDLEELKKVASSLVSTAATLSTKSGSSGNRTIDVAEAADRASEKVQIVASAGVEMNSSISEISAQVSGTTKIVGEAADLVTETSDEINSLAEASNQIDEVVQLISDIADQTNLLALNATIEAARAGEAGKGFAVVATEVKSLSTQTSRATEQISERIKDIQSRMGSSVSSIGKINTSISNVLEAFTQIAAATEQQSSAVSEIAANIDGTAQDTLEVSNRISGISRNSASSCGAAIKVTWATEDLESLQKHLEMNVNEFLNTIRGT